MAVTIHDHYGQYELVGLVQPIDDFIACHRDGALPLSPPLDFDMPIWRQGTIRIDRWVRSDIPAALVSADILDLIAQRLFDIHYCLHGYALYAGPGFSIDTELCFPLAGRQQPLRNDQCTGNHYRGVGHNVLHCFQLSGALLQASTELIHCAFGILGLHARLFASLYVVGQLEVAVTPVTDFLNQAFMHRVEDLVCLPLTTLLDLVVMLRHQLLGCVLEGYHIKVLLEPVVLKNISDQLAVVVINGLEIEVWCPASVGGLPLTIDLYELQPAGHHLLSTLVVAGAFTHAVIDHVQHFGFQAVICGVNQHCALFQPGSIALQNQVSGSVHQRMSRMDKVSHWLALQAYVLFFKADALVFAQDRCTGLADDTITFANNCWDVPYLVTSGLAGTQFATQSGKGLGEEGSNEIGLQLACFGLLHFLLYRVEVVQPHVLLGQSITLEDFLEVFRIQDRKSVV